MRIFAVFLALLLLPSVWAFGIVTPQAFTNNATLVQLQETDIVFYLTNGVGVVSDVTFFVETPVGLQVEGRQRYDFRDDFAPQESRAVTVEFYGLVPGTYTVWYGASVREGSAMMESVIQRYVNVTVLAQNISGGGIIINTTTNGTTNTTNASVTNTSSSGVQVEVNATSASSNSVAPVRRSGGGGGGGSVAAVREPEEVLSKQSPASADSSHVDEPIVQDISPQGTGVSQVAVPTNVPQVPVALSDRSSSDVARSTVGGSEVLLLAVFGGVAFFGSLLSLIIYRRAFS